MENSKELQERFKELHKKTKNGTFIRSPSGDDMVDLLAICIELRKRGFILSEDESYWIKPVGNG